MRRKSDAAFFFSLVRNRNLRGFQVGWARGKDKFGAYLNGLRLRIRLSTAVQRIILVRDSDLDPPLAFADAIEQVRAAKDHPYPIPAQPNTMATNGSPHVSVVLLPDSTESGTLETLLVRSIQRRSPQLFQCMTDYAQCSSAHHWDVGKLSKMQLHSMIAASCPQNPGCSLTTIWAEKDNPIFLDDDCFNPICNYLNQFAI